MPLPTELEDIAARAVTTWGNHSQEMVALGELGELITLFGRRAQKRDTEAEWIDEIADGFIMMTQLAHIHGTEAVNERMKEKLKKLQAKIESKEKPEDPDDIGDPEDEVAPVSVVDCLKSYMNHLACDPGSDIEEERVREGLHLSGVLVTPCNATGTEAAIIAGDGIHRFPGVQLWRGVLVALAFTSEHGDSIIREYHFHKGDVYTRDIPYPDLAISHIDLLDIWRD